MSRPRDPVDMTIRPEELERVQATLADLRRAELVTPTGVRPVEDVQAPAVSPPSRSAPDKPPRTGKAQPSRSRHRSRERRAQLRRDQAGVPCACDDKTPCLAHAGITGRRRHVRPR